MKRIAVIEPTLESYLSLKRNILFFDEIIFLYDYFRTSIKKVTRPVMESGLNPEFIKAEYKYLIENEFLIDATPYLIKPYFYQRFWGATSRELEKLEKLDDINLKLRRMMNYLYLQDTYTTRHLATLINEGLKDQLICYPIIKKFVEFNELSIESRKEDVLHIVLNRVPVPDDTVPWEQIKEFKSDSYIKHKLDELRIWITNTAINEKKTKLEIEEELQFLLNEYEQQMKLAKLSYTLSNWETVIVTTLEIIEDLVKFKWSKVAKMYFGFDKTNVELLKAEGNAKGREVAYISKVGEVFGKNHKLR